MYLDISLLHKNGRTYKRVLLRESYREQGKVKKSTIANLSACSEKEIAAIKLSIPSQIGHPFQCKSATHSNPNRPLIPTQIGHP